MTARIVFWVCGLGVLGCTGGSGQSTQTAQQCGIRVNLPVRITEDSVGPLPISAPLSRLRQLCSLARDTIAYGEESSYPALVFHFGGLRIVAAQQDRDSLDMGHTAETWFVRGKEGMLPSSVPLSARWSTLRKTYGPGIGQSGSDVTVMFCKLPRMLFTLDADPERVGDIAAHGLSTIPDSTTIREVTIVAPPGLGGWVCRA